MILYLKMYFLLKENQTLEIREMIIGNKIHRSLHLEIKPKFRPIKKRRISKFLSEKE